VERPHLARTLHCYAESRDGGWEAICFDLDIAVQGGSFEEVYRALAEAIAAYFETVNDLPESERGHLLRRKAPISVRISFVLRAVRTILFGRDNDSQYAGFTLPAAA
jgi:predicted RNase H-like HicB family nuclease